MEENVFVVYDRNVEDLALTLAPGRPAYPITADEDHKTIDSVMDICRWLLSQGADRNALVYAVGGGVTTDLVGFAASIYKRGVRYVNYPTTLLCQVDAGLGGKTGCNLDSYKNMIGVIAFPEQKIIIPHGIRRLTAGPQDPSGARTAQRRRRDAQELHHRGPRGLLREGRCPALRTRDGL